MGNYSMFIVAFLAVAVVVYMLIKKMDIKITLFTIGILLMFISIFVGNGIAIKDFQSTGILLLDPIKAVAIRFKSIIESSGFVILILGGYSAYMTKIKANDVTVRALIKPIYGIKSVYILVPLVFFIGNILSLVVPSASNLAIILLATLYPIMIRVGMTPLTAGAVIATTATVIPTPLGSDNVAIASELAKTAQFAGITASDYVFKYHAMISIPTILVMGIVHYFWQKYQDKKSNDLSVKKVEVDELEEIKGGPLFKTVYAILPLLPIILLITVFILNSAFKSNITLTVEVAVIFSFIIALICEIIKSKNAKQTLSDSESFFKGMGSAMPIVALLVAGTVFVVGLQSIGIIEALKQIMIGVNGQEFGFVLPLIMVLLTALIVILSGSGTALFFAMIPLLVPLAEAAGISVLALSIPMGLAGNILRAVSPVSAVIMIVAGSIHKEPIQIVRRTVIPMIAGVIFMFVASMIIFL